MGFGKLLLDGILPLDEACGICDRVVLLEPPYICPDCLKKLPIIKHPCLKCGRPKQGPHHPCAFCNPSAEPYTRRYLGYELSAEALYLVHKYKYTGNRYLAPALAHLFIGRLKCLINVESGHATGVEIYPPWPFDYITSIPSGGRRRRARGFDHCRELAEAVAALMGLPYVSLLERRVHERAQAESNRQEREENMRGAFALKDGAETSAMARVKDKHRPRVLLIDDVLTTGATLDEAALYLQGAMPDLDLSIGALFFTLPKEMA